MAESHVRGLLDMLRHGMYLLSRLEVHPEGVLDAEP